MPRKFEGVIRWSDDTAGVPGTATLVNADRVILYVEYADDGLWEYDVPLDRTERGDFHGPFTLRPGHHPIGNATARLYIDGTRLALIGEWVENGYDDSNWTGEFDEVEDEGE